MEQTAQIVTVQRPAFYGIGFRWEGTFAEAAAGGIRAVHQELQRRLHEIASVVNPDKYLGLSYHAQPEGDGFTHYAVVVVANVEHIPEGMMQVTVPALSYAKYEHRKGQDINQSYQTIEGWMAQQGFSTIKGGLTHLEEYPMDQDPHSENPEFVIMIPIEKLERSL